MVSTVTAAASQAQAVQHSGWNPGPGTGREGHHRAADHGPRDAAAEPVAHADADAHSQRPHQAGGDLAMPGGPERQPGHCGSEKATGEPPGHAGADAVR